MSEVRRWMCWNVWGYWQPPRNTRRGFGAPPSSIVTAMSCSGTPNRRPPAVQSTVPISSCYVTILSNCSTGQLNPALNTCSTTAFPHCRTTATRVRVTLSAAAREFDLVIGADGLHSNVRRLVFGPEEQFVKRLGTHAAIFTVPNFLELDYWQTWHYGDSTMAGVYSARNNTEARAALAFMDTELRIDYRDTEAQFAELQRRMAEDGWVRAQLLHYMRSAPDFYFDEMSQILMDRWSRGRVALVGDAGYCCSPLSGQGTSVALLGAYILAGELKAAGDDYQLGFANYHAEFHGFVERNQWLVSDNIPGGAPIPQEEFERIVHSITIKDY